MPLDLTADTVTVTEQLVNIFSVSLDEQEIAGLHPPAGFFVMKNGRVGAAADDGEPMTRARAARECWMRTEKANPHQDLDKRADVVNKCIDDKLKAAGSAAPKT